MAVLPFITTPALSGVNLGPLEEVSRRILVLHGWDEKHVGEPAPAAESTLTSRLLRQPLEWLGGTLDFHLASGTDFLPDHHDFAAVVLDPDLVLGAEQQQTLAAWLPSLRARNSPLLLTGMPFTDSAARQLAMQQLGLGGSAQPASRLIKTNVVSMDSTLLRANARITPRSFGFLHLEAPADARIVLALRGQDALGSEQRLIRLFSPVGAVPGSSQRWKPPGRRLICPPSWPSGSALTAALRCQTPPPAKAAVFSTATSTAPASLSLRLSPAFRCAPR